MDPAPTSASVAQEFSVLKDGGIIGPMSLAELRSGLADGRFAESDLVQHAKVPLWRRVATLPAVGEVQAGFAREWGWREISGAAVARLREDVQSASLATAAVFLALGLAAWLLTHWPVFLWLPWFIPPVAAGVIALTRGDLRRGLLLLLTVAAVPALATTFRPKPALPTLPPESASPDRAPAELPPAVPIPVAKVAPIEPELPSVNVRQIPLPPDKPAALKPLVPAAPGEHRLDQ